MNMKEYDKRAILQIYFEYFANEMTQSEIKKVMKRLKNLGVIKVNGFNIDDLLSKNNKIEVVY